MKKLLLKIRSSSFLMNAFLLCLMLLPFILLIGHMTTRIFTSTSEVTMLPYERRGNYISCFDVRSDGYLAVGFNRNAIQDKYVIQVYDSSGDYQYGYYFRTSGFVYFEWQENNIAIKSVRSGTIRLYNSQGELLSSYNPKTDIGEPLTMKEEDACNWSPVFSVKKRERDDGTYILKHTKIVRVGPEGNKEIVYDAGNGFMVSIMTVFAIITAVIIIFALLLKREKKLQQKSAKYAP